MDILTIWGWPPEEAGPELLDAWDEYAVDSNPEGFEQAQHDAPKKRGIDPQWIRVITLRVSSREIDKAFEPQVVKATVL